MVGGRIVVVVFAVLATLLIAARPICEAAGASKSVVHTVLGGSFGHAAISHVQHEGSDPDCCATMQGGTLVKASEPWAQLPSGGELALLIVAFVFTVAPVLPRAATIPLRPDPRTLSYYRRSARILR